MITNLEKGQLTEAAISKAQSFRTESTGKSNTGKIICAAKRILFEDNQAEDLNFSNGSKHTKMKLMQDAVKYLVEEVMELTPAEYDAIYSTNLNQKTTLHHAIRKIANSASPSILRETLFDSKKILFRTCWPEYYAEHYKSPKAMDIFNCTGEIKGSLIRASIIKEVQEESTETKQLKNVSFF